MMGLDADRQAVYVREVNVARGFKTGGRKPLSAAGPAIPMRFRFQRELVADLVEMAEETETTAAEIVRRVVEAEVRRWRKRTGRPPR